MKSVLSLGGFLPHSLWVRCWKVESLLGPPGRHGEHVQELLEPRSTGNVPCSMRHLGTWPSSPEPKWYKGRGLQIGQVGCSRAVKLATTQLPGKGRSSLLSGEMARAPEKSAGPICSTHLHWSLGCFFFFCNLIENQAFHSTVTQKCYPLTGKKKIR
jgi:hypothetical protein